MASSTVHSMRMECIQSYATLGRGNGKDEMAVLSFPDRNGRCHNVLFSDPAVINDAKHDANCSSVSSDLRDIAETINSAVAKLISGGVRIFVGTSFPITPFCTKVQELITHRNTKIENSGWVAFLDILLKILTLGFFSYKESLKAPNISMPTAEDLQKIEENRLLP